MLRRALPVALLALIAGGAGCGGGGEKKERAEPAPAATTPATPPRKPAPTAPGVGLQQVGSFSKPVYVTSPPGDASRLFVVEQDGRVRMVRSGQVRKRPFLDIRDDVESGGERGLLSMAFAPDYDTSRLFYVYFTDHTGDIRIQQFRANLLPEAADMGSRADVLRVKHSTYPNHNGGQLVFGPDRKLYAGFGDGGGAGDPFKSGQRLNTLLAKIIRIEPRRGGGYRIPADNPFAKRAGARREIWAYGLRNPYRFNFDRRTGDLTIGDVGQDEFEEVDFRPDRGRGVNFGWSVFEGFKRFRSGTAAGAVKPKLAPTHEAGFCALIGGYVVRDPELPALAGSYLYGDNCNPRIYSARLKPKGDQENRATALRVPALSSFGEDAKGRVYATSLNGPVYRLVPK